RRSKFSTWNIRFVLQHQNTSTNGIKITKINSYLSRSTDKIRFIVVIFVTQLNKNAQKHV
uniref:hypothetical protein n=1 Tax=Fluviicola sp. TaxID=1917219 RepID=UPI004049C88F